MDELTNEFMKISNLYKLYCTEQGFKNKKIEIPTFQRLKCWDEDMSKRLIASIYKKYPIGIITTYLHRVDKNTEKLIIIDGLQRINSIVSYLEHPFGNKYHDNELREEIENFSKILDIDKNIISNIFTQYFSSENFKYSGKLIKNRRDDPIKIALTELLPPIDIDKSNRLYELLNDLSNKFIDKFYDLLEYQVQIAICHCTEQELPEIFENLNVNSKKLEANEIFAATWQYQPDIIVENISIITNINLYYRHIENVYGNKIRFDLEKQINMSNGKYNCYEYLMGLAQLIIDRIGRDDIRNIFYDKINDTKTIKKQVIFDMVTIILSDKCVATDIPKMITSFNIYELRIFEELVLDAADFTVKVVEWAYQAYDKMVFGKNISIYHFTIVFRTYFKNKQLIEENRRYYIQLFTLHLFLNKLTSGIVNINSQNIKNIPKKCNIYMGKVSAVIMKDAIMKAHHKNNQTLVPYFFFLLNKYNMINSNHYNVKSLSTTKRFGNKSSLWKNIVTGEVISKLNDIRLIRSMNNMGNIYFSPNVINYMNDVRDECVNINDYNNCVISEEFRLGILVKLNEDVETSNVTNILKMIDMRTEALINIFLDTFKLFVNY